MRIRMRRPARSSLLGALGLGAAALLVALVGVPMSGAGLIAVIGNTDTVSSSGATCRWALTGAPAGPAYFGYPFSESSGTVAADATGNAHPGTYSSTGIAYGASAPCPRDNTSAVTLDGSTGYISGPVASVAAPNTFSIAVWFNTTASQGKLIGFGSSRTGSSGTVDRQLYISSTGTLVFGVAPALSSFQTIATTAKVTDGAWHFAVATMSSAGMVLYLDGVQIGTNTTTSGAIYLLGGYWRIGYDNLLLWPGVGTNYFFKGSLAFASEFTYALSAAQVTAMYNAGK